MSNHFDDMRECMSRIQLSVMREQFPCDEEIELRASKPDGEKVFCMIRKTEIMGLLPRQKIEAKVYNYPLDLNNKVVNLYHLDGTPYCENASITNLVEENCGKITLICKWEK